MSAVERSRCVIAVPVGSSIVPECEAGLRELERRGYPVRIFRGYSQIDIARCQIATDLLGEGFEELFWIDSDIWFNPDDVDKLRAYQLPYVCGIYAKKGPREFAATYLPGTTEIRFGEHGGLTEFLYTGFGFNYTHRSLYEDLERQLQLPKCNRQFIRPLVPYFMPFATETPDGPWYLGEDYAFCERARRCGHRILADTTVRLWHMGQYPFSWEDAGSSKDRYANYLFRTGLAPLPDAANPVASEGCLEAESPVAESAVAESSVVESAEAALAEVPLEVTSSEVTTSADR